MGKYLGLVKLSAAEASRMVRDGPAARREFVELIVREGGGAVENLWLTNVGDWDLICVIDMADASTATGAAATLARRASGFTDGERWIELVEVDDVAHALEKMAGARPAGGTHHD